MAPCIGFSFFFLMSLFLARGCDVKDPELGHDGGHGASDCEQHRTERSQQRVLVPLGGRSETPQAGPDGRRRAPIPTGGLGRRNGATPTLTAVSIINPVTTKRSRVQ